MTQYTRFLELRWRTLATLAVCALLPGCPFTDDYFITDSSAGAGQTLGTAGSSEISGAGGVLMAAGGLATGGEECSCASGGQVHVAGNSGSLAGGSGGGPAGSTGGAEAGSPGDDAGSPSTGGTGGSGGSTTTAGTAGTAGVPSNLPQPACTDGVVKGSACTAGTPTCYKSCGPDNLGFKSEFCQLGVYAESNCNFPTGQDYTCYKIPPALPGDCPSGMPRGGRPCDIVSCTVCFGGTLGAPLYQDSTGAQKPGYCVCSDAGIWTCGSVDSGSWPCPGPGCN